MKLCIDCKLTKDFAEYSRHATTTDRLMQRCKSCQSAYNARYREANRERLNANDRKLAASQTEVRRERSRQWREENPKRRQDQIKDYYQRHKDAGTLDLYYGKRDPEAMRQRAKQWRKDNPARVAYNIALARARRHQAVPKWLTKEEKSAIKRLYEQCQKLSQETGIPHQVDHIYPLVSDIVCGLHCLANLQILTAAENNRKKCKVQS
jgi:flagellum-specific peptidoglycan hydrolase FlgJ